MAKKILLVDDETDFLDIMGERIRSWGYEVILVSNGKEAIEAIRRKEPEIVILDYLMPEMDGIDTLKQIRRIDKDIPVIMFTAYPEMKAIDGTEKLGVSAFVPKLSVYTDVQISLKSAINMVEKKLIKS